MKFEIRHRWNGAELFSLETTSMKLCVEAAVKSSADLSGAYLSGANLSRANLSSANLSSANLSRADLSGANLYGANLSGANLSGANLSGANLYRADLYGANLYRANLSGADLSSANLSGAMGINPYRCTSLLMLLDQPGKIRAYKLVNQGGEGPYQGGITYKIGGTYSVSDANTDVTEQCGAGINLATLDWCIREWKQGYRILIAEFTAKDIAAIPTATDGKFRVKKCEIVGEKDLIQIGLISSSAAAPSDQQAVEDKQEVEG